MTEQDTFKKLKQIPVEDMLAVYRAASTRLSKVVSMGHNPQQFGPTGHMPESLRPTELILHYARLKLLEENGWTFDEFVTEVERIAIIEEIKILNAAIAYPTELLDRAKQFFPNAKFTEAHIEF